MEQSLALWQAPNNRDLKGKRDRALLALLLACGLRRHEAIGLRLEHLEQREEHWAIVDLKGKAGHVRTVPVPGWSRSSFFWDTFPFRPPNATWVANSGFGRRSMIESESNLVSESRILPLGN
jgi:hypothetical protein